MSYLHFEKVIPKFEQITTQQNGWCLKTQLPMQNSILPYAAVHFPINAGCSHLHCLILQMCLHYFLQIDISYLTFFSYTDIEINKPYLLFFVSRWQAFEGGNGGYAFPCQPYSLLFLRILTVVKKCLLSGSVKTNMGFVLPALLFRAHPPSFTMVNLHWAQPAYLAGSPEAGEANGK